MTFRNLAHSDALANHFRRRAEKLEHLFDGIISCHVVLELAGHHHRHGGRYCVCIHVGVPGREILVRHAPSDEQNVETADAAADRAFDAAERQLEDWVRRQREHRHEDVRRPT